MLGPLAAATAIFNRDITAERWRQLKKFGDQRDVPDGTDWDLDVVLALQCKRECDVAFAEGRGTWRHILLEEVHEAFAETETAKLRKELIEVATVAIAWVEALDNRAGDRVGRQPKPTPWEATAGAPRVPLPSVLADSATLWATTSPAERGSLVQSTSR